MDKDQNNKARLSVRTKLIIIVSIIIAVSLGSITALVSWLVREDLKIAAEENNFEANRRAAEEAEELLSNMRAASGQLMYTINALGASQAAAPQAAAPQTTARQTTARQTTARQTATQQAAAARQAAAQQAAAQQAADFFFAQNPRAAAFACTLKGSRNVFVNRDYFQANNIDPSLAETYFTNNEVFLSRAARGDTALLNAAPVFKRPVLALFFTWQAGQDGAGCVLIAAEKLVDSFGFGTNQSFLINDKCDLLAHSDADLLRNGANVAGFDFIREIQQAPERNKQQLMKNAFFNFEPPESRGSTSSAQYFTAFTKLSFGGCIVITGIGRDTVFEGIIATTRRNIYLTAAVLFISIMITWFFSKKITKQAGE